VQDEEHKVFSPNLQNFIETWVNQNGHPVVHVQIINETTISIKQERFLYDQSSSKAYNRKKYENY
jgi:aminopeptidase N